MHSIHFVCLSLHMHEVELVWDTLLLMLSTEPSLIYIRHHLVDMHSDNLAFTACSLLHITQQSV